MKDDFLEARLLVRQQQGNQRALPHASGLADFCSNDYLGFARSKQLAGTVEQRIKACKECTHGSTGSRLISGNQEMFSLLEGEVAAFHRAETALIFNSGYDANIGLISAVAARGDTVIHDELCHASTRDGIRLSFARSYGFKHNSIDDLRKKLRIACGQIFVTIESLYSMDGDVAPLGDIAALCVESGALLIVDEAHATGVLGPDGRGLVSECALEQSVFARVHTFGKALGVHGAAVLGSDLLRRYLVNFSRPLIYTTAMPPHAVLAVSAAYKLLRESSGVIGELLRKVSLFRSRIGSLPGVISDSRSPIQALVVGGSRATRTAAEQLRDRGFNVKAILTPTVHAGSERLRICLHVFNSDQDILNLADALQVVAK